MGGGGGKGSQQQQGGVAGWNEYVKPYYQESKFWHSIWESAGRPLTGNLFNIMKHTKLQYKYAFRRVKKAKNKIQNDSFVTGVLQGGVKMYEEIRKVRGKVKKYNRR